MPEVTLSCHLGILAPDDFKPRQLRPLLIDMDFSLCYGGTRSVTRSGFGITQVNELVLFEGWMKCDITKSTLASKSDLRNAFYFSKKDAFIV